MNFRRNNQIIKRSKQNHNKKWNEELKFKKKLASVEICHHTKGNIEPKSNKLRITRKLTLPSSTATTSYPFNFRRSDDTECRIFQQSEIFHEDVLKLQNLICGGYIEDEETFLCLDQLKQKKSDFVLLNDIYERARKAATRKKIVVKDIENRNMLSLALILENMKNLSRTELKYLSKKLKIVI